MRFFYLFVCLCALVVVACSFPSDKGKENALNTSPEFFGWTNERVDSLKKECLERFGKGDTTRAKYKDNYCNCLVNKISLSVKWEQHETPDEKTATMYDEFGKACEELTVNEK